MDFQRSEYIICVQTSANLAFRTFPVAGIDVPVSAILSYGSVPGNAAAYLAYMTAVYSFLQMYTRL